MSRCLAPRHPFPRARGAVAALAVLCFVWAGMVLGISFLEAPVKLKRRASRWWSVSTIVGGLHPLDRVSAVTSRAESPSSSAPGSTPCSGERRTEASGRSACATPDERIFAGVPMSTAQTGAAQRRRLDDLGLGVTELEALRDVDTIADAYAVAADRTNSRFARARGHGTTRECSLGAERGGARRGVTAARTRRAANTFAYLLAYPTLPSLASSRSRMRSSRSSAWQRLRPKRLGVVAGARWSEWTSTTGASSRRAISHWRPLGTSTSMVVTRTTIGWRTSSSHARSAASTAGRVTYVDADEDP